MKKFKYRIYKHTDGNGVSHYVAERVRAWWFNDILWDWWNNSPSRFTTLDAAEMACVENAHKLRSKTYTIEIAREFET